MDNRNNGSFNKVKEHGEVFTPDSIVNDMLDLVKEKVSENEEYITKTFLEPACGDGQFLIRILYRKLCQVEKLPIEQRQTALIKSISSIYGVDIQSDNIIKAKKRLYDLATGQKVRSFDLNDKTNEIQIDLCIEYTEQLKKVINFIIDNNIIVGDALKPSGDSEEVIVTAYHFNDTNRKVRLAKAPLNYPEMEYDLSNEVDIMDMPNINTGSDDEDFDF